MAHPNEVRMHYEGGPRDGATDTGLAIGSAFETKWELGEIGAGLALEYMAKRGEEIAAGGPPDIVPRPAMVFYEYALQREDGADRYYRATGETRNGFEDVE